MPEIELVDTDYRRSLLKAVQSFIEDEFDLCLVSGEYPGEEIEAFFRDVSSLKTEAETIYVQVLSGKDDHFDRKSCRELGFDTAITLKVTDGDKAAIQEQLKGLMARKEISRRRVNVDAALKLLMLEIDRVSKDTKRGHGRGFQRKSVADFMANEMDATYVEVLEAYYAALEKYADKGHPFKETRLILPNEIANKKLPGVMDGSYTGTSLRVWEMLHEKFGEVVTEDGKATTDAELGARAREAEEKIKRKLDELSSDEGAASTDGDS